MGFEPTHGDRIGLAVQRLNHSATLFYSLSKMNVFLMNEYDLNVCYQIETDYDSF